MRVAFRVLFGIAVTVAVAGSSLPALAQQGMGHGMGMGHGHGMGEGRGMGMGMAHRMTAMLQGVDTTDGEVTELGDMLMNHQDITRSVDNLPNGIRTVTESANPELAGQIVSHVVGMIGRVEDGRDPHVRIQSPTLDLIFANRDLIETVLEATPTGIIVTQTSSDPATVAALQTHAAEVTDMVDRGMAAVHDSMMRR
jgi:hypothetical protein